MSESTTRRLGGLDKSATGQGSWQEHHGNAYRCQVVLTQAKDKWTAAATMLAGIAAEGETEQDALVNVKKALSVAVAQHKTADEAIPWNEAPSVAPGATIRW